jgi:hypothetical protein
MTIDVWSWSAPNGQKVHVALEEPGRPFRVVPVNNVTGEPLCPGFPAITFNRRIRTIAARSAVQRGAAMSSEKQRKGPVNEAEREQLSGAPRSQAR